MKRILATFFLVTLAAPALAEVDMTSLQGLYGQVGDPEWSCEVNPVELSVIPSPPHLVFQFSQPGRVYDGRVTDHAVYDVREVTSTGIVARLEGETRRAPDGSVVLWVLRPWPDNDGFCWGRTDWSILQCVSQHVRCQDNAPTS